MHGRALRTGVKPERVDRPIRAARGCRYQITAPRQQDDIGALLSRSDEHPALRGRANAPRQGLAAAAASTGGASRVLDAVAMSTTFTG